MDLLELSAKLSLDTSGYEQGMEKAESDASGFGSKLTGFLSGAAKVGIASVTAAATAVGAMTKKAVENFADYEQLAGGIETLFGDSAQTVMDNASKAFETAGMDANQYMETSIQSASALINSLGGDQAKAAELMNTSITDMADNANKLGTDMESIQNAYKGFSRGNFTMLDNLALGFSGTKEGMQELLNKAQEISGVEYNIDSYSDIVEAIHTVQTEMGISGMTAEEAAEAVRNGTMTEEEAFNAMGTTAKEASSTVQGSLGMLKSSWDNLLTGIADPNADLGALIDNVISSAGTAAQNLLPVVETALSGMAQLIETVMPQVAEKVPTILLEIAPKLLSAGVNIITALAQGLLQQAPTLLKTGIELLVDLVKGLAEGLPQAIPMIVSCVLGIVDTLLDNIDMLIDAGIQLILGLAEGLIEALPELVEKVPEIITKLLDAIVRNAPKLAEAGLRLIEMLLKGIISSVPKLLSQVPKVIKSLVSAFVGALGAVASIGVHIVQGIWSGIINSLSWIKNKISGWVDNVVDFLKRLFKIASPSKLMRDEIGKYLALGVWEGWEQNNPIDMINADVDTLRNGISISTDYKGSNVSRETLFDYEKLANTMVYAFDKANLGIYLDRREFGRVTREVINYG